MNAEIAAMCDRVLSAVLNGAWQGLILSAGVAAVFRCRGGLNAASRHAVAVATLLLVAALPVAHFFLAGGESGRFLGDSPPAPALVEMPIPYSGEVEIAPSAQPAGFAATSESAVFLPPYASAILVGTWIGLAVIRLVFLYAQLFALRSLKRSGGPALESLGELFSRLCVELGVSRAPLLRLTDRIPAPIAVGFKRPAVLLPARLCEEESGSGLEQILRHELAHVLRRDDWWNLVQQTLRALFFFHPGVLWLSRRMTVDREIACDDHVLSALSDRRAYALALTEFASRNRGRVVAAAPAAWSNHSQLKQRIDMILDTKRNISPRLARGRTGLIAFVAVVTAILAFHSAPRLAFAQSPDQPPEAPLPPVEAVEAMPPAAPKLTLEPPEIALEVDVPVHTTIRAPRVATITSSGGRIHAKVASTEPGMSDKPRTKSREKSGEETVEQRLENLERMVESMARRDAKNFSYERNFNWNADSFLNEEERSKIHAKAAKEAERAAREVEKVVKEVQKRGEVQRLAKGAERGSRERIQASRRALQEQRRALEKQMQALERQIDRLEQEQERFEEKHADGAAHQHEVEHEHEHEKEKDSQKQKDNVK